MELFQFWPKTNHGMIWQIIHVCIFWPYLEWPYWVFISSNYFEIRRKKNNKTNYLWYWNKLAGGVKNDIDVGSKIQIVGFGLESGIIDIFTDLSGYYLVQIKYKQTIFFMENCANFNSNIISVQNCGYESSAPTGYLRFSGALWNIGCVNA